MDQTISTLDEQRFRVAEPSISLRDTSAGRHRARQRYQPSLRSVLLAAAAIAGLAGAGVYGDYYWTTGRFMVSTDDAYLQADNVIISPKVAGYISDVAGAGQPAGEGRPGAGPHRRPRLPHRARRRPGERGRGSRRHRQPGAADRRAAARGHRGAGHSRGRPGRPDLRRPGLPAATPRCPGPAPARCRSAQQATSRLPARSRPRWSTTPPRVGAARKQIDVLRAQLAQARATLAQQQAGAAPGGAERELHHDHRADRRHGRRPHACASGNTCRPARS